MKNFYFRIENLELRATDEHLGNLGPLSTAAILQWNAKMAWVVAYWVDKSDGGHELQFCGKRPFDVNINRGDFWKLAEMGQSLLGDADKERIYVSE